MKRLEDTLPCPSESENKMEDFVEFIVNIVSAHRQILGMALVVCV